MTMSFHINTARPVAGSVAKQDHTKVTSSAEEEESDDAAQQTFVL